uniref:carbohydrate-binding family 9-like protein n=1 Tax=Pedobacter schmidteae TaxID=2201271 RepID=UPI000EAB85BB|nr:carbohydrate-binding family 9-like protein [Pedobacter schmidteae]
MIKKIDVPFVDVAGKELDDIKKLMDEQPLHPINLVNWPEFETGASADFSIVHNNSSIFVRYTVAESVLKSTSRDFNQHVHLDNCVEFFIGFGPGRHYYNVELNCLASIKIGYGEGRENREALAPELLEQVRISVVMDYQPNSGPHAFKWQLLMILPTAVFCHDRIVEFGGISGNANFYKCGDELPEPHFLTWNKVDTAGPDFHQPTFFGQLNFMPAK